DRNGAGLSCHDPARYGAAAPAHGPRGLPGDGRRAGRFCADWPITLSVAGITLPAVQVAGALVLLLVALDMLRAQRSPVMETAAETAEASGKDDIAITPLAIPMLAGPAAISTVILLDAQAAGWAQRSILLACLAVVGLASYIILALGAKGAKWLTPMAEKIMTRLMGLLLAALAVQFLFNGLKGEGGLLQQ
ncbi:MAG: MarC family protein, partial [Nitrospirota bacterium]